MSENRNDLLHSLNSIFIAEIGMPASRREVVARAFMAWWQSEGGATKCKPECGWETDWNPFNTTKVVVGHSHNQPHNSVPVQVYDSREVGLRATADTIKEPRYAAIRAAMVKPGGHALTICKRIAESEWGTPLHPMVDVLADITQRGLWHDYADITVYPS